MCGINGLFGDINRSDLGDFKTQSILTQLRGKHSTGFAAVYADMTYDCEKAVGGLESLVKKYKQHFDQESWNYIPYSVKGPDEKYTSVYPDFLLNHGRWATSGAVNEDNAQPFFFEGKGGAIVGCHNGTIYDYFASKFWPEFDKSGKSDSYWIFKDIADLETEEEIVEYIGKLRGAYTLIWYDIERGSMYAVRNHLRPLFVVGTDASGKTMAFASTRWQLKVSYNENPIEVKDDVLLRFDNTAAGIECNEVGKIKFVESGVNYSRVNDYSDYFAKWDDDYTPNPQYQYVRKEGTNVWVSKKEWDDSNYMCECCLCALPSEKAATVTWVHHDVPLCSECHDSGKFMSALTGTDH